MNNIDTQAKAYTDMFWPEKPELIKSMIENGYSAGANSFRGQAAIAAMQSMILNYKTQRFMIDIDKENIATSAVALADALIAELNK